MAKKTWVLSVDEEGVISFPDDLINVMGWDEGTELSWQEETDGSITLKRVDHQDVDLDKTVQPT